MRSLTSTIIVLACVAAGPATRPAEEKSSDGVPFPSVTLPTHNPPPSSRLKLHDAFGMLLVTPGESGLRIFNANKHADMLKSRLTWRVSSDSSTNDGRSTETIHGTVTGSGDAHAEWFSIDLAGADVAGLDLTEGVISRVTLFYKHGDVARRMLAKEYARGDSPWRLEKNGPSLTLQTEVPDVMMYAIHHPEMPGEVRAAMLDGRLVRGITIEQAKMAIGKPYSITDSGRTVMMTWQVREGEFWHARFVDGVADTVSHSAY